MNDDHVTQHHADHHEREMWLDALCREAHRALSQIDGPRAPGLLELLERAGRGEGPEAAEFLHPPMAPEVLERTSIAELSRQ